MQQEGGVRSTSKPKKSGPKPTATDRWQPQNKEVVMERLLTGQMALAQFVNDSLATMVDPIRNPSWNQEKTSDWRGWKIGRDDLNRFLRHLMHKNGIDKLMTQHGISRDAITRQQRIDLVRHIQGHSRYLGTLSDYMNSLVIRVKDRGASPKSVSEDYARVGPTPMAPIPEMEVAVPKASRSLFDEALKQVVKDRMLKKPTNTTKPKKLEAYRDRRSSSSVSPNDNEPVIPKVPRNKNSRADRLAKRNNPLNPVSVKKTVNQLEDMFKEFGLNNQDDTGLVKELRTMGISRQRKAQPKKK